jgi:hypothetical protein
MVAPTFPKGSKWTKGCCLHRPGRPCPLVLRGQGQNPRVFLWAKAKGNLGGKFSPWGHRLDLEAKAAPLAAPLAYLKGRGGLGHAHLKP